MLAPTTQSASISRSGGGGATTLCFSSREIGPNRTAHSNSPAADGNRNDDVCGVPSGNCVREPQMPTSGCVSMNVSSVRIAPGNTTVSGLSSSTKSGRSVPSRYGWMPALLANAKPPLVASGRRSHHADHSFWRIALLSTATDSSGDAPSITHVRTPPSIAAISGASDRRQSTARPAER